MLFRHLVVVVAALVIGACSAASDDVASSLRGAVNNNSTAAGIVDNFGGNSSLFDDSSKISSRLEDLDALFASLSDDAYGNSSRLEVSFLESNEGGRRLSPFGTAAMTAAGTVLGTEFTGRLVSTLFDWLDSDANAAAVAKEEAERSRAIDIWLRDTVDEMCTTIDWWWNQVQNYDNDLRFIGEKGGCKSWHVFAWKYNIEDDPGTSGFLFEPKNRPSRGLYYKLYTNNGLRVAIFNQPAALYGPLSNWKNKHGNNGPSFVENRPRSRYYSQEFFFNSPPAEIDFPKNFHRFMFFTSCKDSYYRGECRTKKVNLLRNYNTCMNLSELDDPSSTFDRTMSSAAWSPFPFMKEFCFHDQPDCKGYRRCWGVDKIPPRDLSQDKFWHSGGAMNDRVRSIQFKHYSQEEMTRIVW